MSSVARSAEEALAEAQRLLEDGHSSRAISLLQLSARSFKRSAPIWVALGAALAAMGREVEALDAYRESTLIIARDAEVWVAMAVIAERLGKSSDAYASWKHALRARPALFVERPAFLVLWKECHEPEKEFEKLAFRLLTREDLSAAFAFLDEVLVHEEVPIALACCRRTASENRASLSLTVVAAVLAAASDLVESLADLTTVGLMRDASGELLVSDDQFTRLLRIVARLSGERWEPFVVAASEAGASRIVRSCYAAAEQSSGAALYALTALMANMTSRLHEAECSA